MNNYMIQYKSPYGNGRTVINANCKRDAMVEFNNKTRGYFKEIIKITNITNNGNNEENDMDEKKQIERLALIEKKKAKQIKLNNMLEETNNILFNQLKKIKDIDLSDKEKAMLEITKNNALSGTGKVLIQSIGMQMMIDKQA